MNEPYTDAVAEQLRDRSHDLSSLGTLITEKLEGPHRTTIVASLSMTARGLERMADEHDRFRAMLRAVIHEHSVPEHTCTSAECLVSDVRRCVSAYLGEAVPRDPSLLSRRKRVREQRWRRELSAAEDAVDRERVANGLKPIYGTIEQVSP